MWIKLQEKRNDSEDTNDLYLDSTKICSVQGFDDVTYVQLQDQLYTVINKAEEILALMNCSIYHVLNIGSSDESFLNHVHNLAERNTVREGKRFLICLGLTDYKV